MGPILRDRDVLRAHVATLANERDQLVTARDSAEAAYIRAEYARRTAEEARWQAVKAYEQAEEARWAAVRAREAADAARQEVLRRRSGVPPDPAARRRPRPPATSADPSPAMRTNGSGSSVDNNAMKISVLLPNYNHGAFIRENVEAVLAQTHENWELIIIDDGSTDGSVDTIRELAARDRRIVPIILPQNRGVISAIQTGLAAMTGELLYGSAADDYISSNLFFERVVKAMADHPETSGAFGKAEVMDAASGDLLWEMGSAPTVGYIAPRLALETFLTGGLFVPGASAVWKRAHIDALGGFDPSLGPQTDFFINHALPAMTGAVFIDDIFVVVRAGTGNYHRSSDTQEFFRRHALVENKLRSIELPAAPDPDWLRAWRERLVDSRLAVSRQRNFFSTVRDAIGDIEPWQRDSLPERFVDCSERVLADMRALERDLADQISAAHQTLDEVAGALPAGLEPRNDAPG